MKRHIILLLLFSLLVFCACGKSEVKSSSSETENSASEAENKHSRQEEDEAAPSPDRGESTAASAIQSVIDNLTKSEPDILPEPSPTSEATPEASPEPVSEPLFGEGYVIAIDAGHCSKPETWLYEPIGPGASETKMKDTGGTAGRYTGIAEYELNLRLALKLQAILEERGYTVYMTRTENEVSLGNIDRAAVANETNADAFIRIHANGSEDNSVHGAMTLCQTPNNPYVHRYEESKLLSVCVLEELCASTGAYQRSIWETDTMAGINWSEVPCTLVEVGFMTNKDEDEKMATEEYRNLIAQGLANGIDRYILERAVMTGAE